ncbi:MotE family protein [Paenibacillus harenae]|uniref:MotE family protein n=1 Tax=Paenibacillus harenae TaxID=306543 RepID=UPI0027D8F894|nr:MgtE protein [Paenibacillus harenae]
MNELAGADAEKQSYSAFERFMFFTTPILFAIVMLVVLLILFNSDIRNKALEVGNSVPFLKDVLPEPKVAAGETSDEQLKADNMSKKIADLQAELTAKGMELATAVEAKTAQEQQIKELEDQIAQLKRSNEEQLVEDEQYQAKVLELSNMFSTISPSKAAPIMQSMTLEEMVLIFNTMRPDDRVRIMEKMNPQTAADAAIKLKDVGKAKDLQIAALQSQVDALKAKSSKPASSILDEEQLSATFTSMNAKSAGELLIKMVDVSPSKALRVLNLVDDTTRSAILAEMSAINESTTAQLVTKLMSGN